MYRHARVERLRKPNLEELSEFRCRLDLRNRMEFFPRKNTRTALSQVRAHLDKVKSGEVTT